MKDFLAVLRMNGEEFGVPVPREAPDFDVRSARTGEKIGIELTSLLNSGEMSALDGHMGLINLLNQLLVADPATESALAARFPNCWMTLVPKAPVPKSLRRTVAGKIMWWLRGNPPTVAANIVPDDPEIMEWVIKAELLEWHLPGFVFSSPNFVGVWATPMLAETISKKNAASRAYENSGALWLVVHDPLASLWAKSVAVCAGVVAAARGCLGDGRFSRLYLFDTHRRRAWRFDGRGCWIPTPTNED